MCKIYGVLCYKIDIPTLYKIRKYRCLQGAEQKSSTGSGIQGALNSSPSFPVGTTDLKQTSSHEPSPSNHGENYRAVTKSASSNCPPPWREAQEAPEPTRVSSGRAKNEPQRETATSLLGAASMKEPHRPAPGTAAAAAGPGRPGAVAASRSRGSRPSPSPGSELEDQPAKASHLPAACGHRSGTSAGASATAGQPPRAGAPPLGSEPGSGPANAPGCPAPPAAPSSAPAAASEPLRGWSGPAGAPSRGAALDGRPMKEARGPVGIPDGEALAGTAATADPSGRPAQGSEHVGRLWTGVQPGWTASGRPLTGAGG